MNLTSTDPRTVAAMQDSVGPISRVTAPATGQKRAIIADSATGGYVAAPQPPSSFPQARQPAPLADNVPLDDATGRPAPFRAPGQPSAADLAMQRHVENSPKSIGQQLAQKWRDDPSTHPANCMPGSDGRSFSL